MQKSDMTIVGAANVRMVLQSQPSIRSFDFGLARFRPNAQERMKLRKIRAWRIAQRRMHSTTILAGPRPRSQPVNCCDMYWQSTESRPKRHWGCNRRVRITQSNIMIDLSLKLHLDKSR
ncbi:hypothetical protein Mapa_018668 [Marchantia paleacea]|nr:hypothetical protein Mapa_018668 [Marchantia paleacea]